MLLNTKNIFFLTFFIISVIILSSYVFFINKNTSTKISQKQIEIDHKLSSKKAELNSKTVKSPNNTVNPDNPRQSDNAGNSELIWQMKAIPANISDADLDLLAQSGFTVLSTEWGIDDLDISEVNNLLDRSALRGLRLILDAGFSAGAWGYVDDGSDSAKQKPVWQKEKVQDYIKKFKNHPALYAWDISNEAGENFPNGEKFRISLNQLKQASADVRAIDPIHPLVIRMHYWDEYDGDFNWKNPFSAGIADIVMLNLYSNYSEDGATPLLPNMIADSGQALVDKIHSIDPSVKIWLCLAAFAEPPMFIEPSAKDLARDLNAASKLKNISSIGFFGWQDESSDWQLRLDGKELLNIIKNFINP